MPGLPPTKSLPCPILACVTWEEVIGTEELPKVAGITPQSPQQWVKRGVFFFSPFILVFTMRHGTFLTRIIRMLVGSLLLTSYLSLIWSTAFFITCQPARIFKDHLVPTPYQMFASLRFCSRRCSAFDIVFILNWFSLSGISKDLNKDAPTWSCVPSLSLISALLFV